jgi:hypothetical protein
VERTYDIFEIVPDGQPRWICAVTGHEEAINRLKELAKTTTNEVRMMHIATNSIVAVMNTKEEQSPR